MGKKTIIAVTALALLGLGGGAYLELGGKAPAGALARSGSCGQSWI
ncbi:hypothetical protein HKT49_25520, partial [Pseudomonas aeruginosa]|nr:hypothetical protein [Pseudomonas aeruginosa]